MTASDISLISTASSAGSSASTGTPGGEAWTQKGSSALTGTPGGGAWTQKGVPASIDGGAAVLEPREFRHPQQIEESAHCVPVPSAVRHARGAGFVDSPTSAGAAIVNGPIGGERRRSRGPRQRPEHCQDQCLEEECAPDDEVNYRRPASTSWQTATQGSLMQVATPAFLGGSVGSSATVGHHPGAEGGKGDATAGCGAAAGLAAEAASGAAGVAQQGGQASLEVLARCGERVRGAGHVGGAGHAPPSSGAMKCRTLKYYPPPTDNTDHVSVDVIDHGSEVLIIRREQTMPVAGTPAVVTDPTRLASARGKFGAPAFTPRANTYPKLTEIDAAPTAASMYASLAPTRQEELVGRRSL